MISRGPKSVHCKYALHSSFISNWLSDEPFLQSTPCTAGTYPPYVIWISQTLTAPYYLNMFTALRGYLAHKCQKYPCNSPFTFVHHSWFQASRMAPAHTHISVFCHFIYCNCKWNTMGTWPISYSPCRYLSSRLKILLPSIFPYTAPSRCPSASQLPFPPFSSVFFPRIFYAPTCCTHLNARMVCCLKQQACQIL